MAVRRVVGSRVARAWSRGFSLLEIFIAVAVMAILVAAATPSFRELGRRMTNTTNTNDIVGALNTARAEAVKRGVMVAVIGTGNNWSSAGWSILADSDHNNALNSSDTVIRSYAALTDGFSVKTKVTGGTDSQIVFGPSGNLIDGATKADINVCRPDTQPHQSAWVRVSGSGEIRSQRDTTSSPAPAC